MVVKSHIASWGDHLYLSSINRLQPTISPSDGRLKDFGRLASQYMLALKVTCDFCAYGRET